MSDPIDRLSLKQMADALKKLRSIKHWAHIPREYVMCKLMRPVDFTVISYTPCSCPACQWDLIWRELNPLPQTIDTEILNQRRFINESKA